jgi:hypothetical protein
VTGSEGVRVVGGARAAVARLGPAVALAVALAAGAALRFAGLGADPPVWMEEAFLVDGGWWAASARAADVVGDPLAVDHGLSLAIVPLYTRVLEAAFGELERSTAVHRGVSAVATLGATAAAVLLAARHGSVSLATAVAALLALSPLYFAQGRAELPEPLQALWSVVGFGLFVARGRAWPAGVAAGLALGAAVATKPTAIATGGLALLLTAALRLAVEPDARRAVLARSVATGVGLALAAAVLVFVHVVPHWDVIEPALSSEPGHYRLGWRQLVAIPGLIGLSKSLVDAGWQPVAWRLLVFSPAIFLGAWSLGLAALARAPDALALARRAPHLERTAAAWIAGWCLPIFAAPAQPDYRFTGVIPLLALLAASRLCGASEPDARARDAARAGFGRLRALFVGGWLLLPLLLPAKAGLTALVMRLGVAVPLGEELGVDVGPAGVIANAACALAVAGCALFPSAVARATRALVRLPARPVLLALLLLEAGLLGLWAARATDSMTVAQARLGATLPAGAQVVATLTSELVLPTEAWPVRRLEPTSGPRDPADPVWESAPPPYVLLPVALNFELWQPGERSLRLLHERGYAERERFALGPWRGARPRFEIVLLERRP